LSIGAGVRVTNSIVVTAGKADVREYSNVFGAMCRTKPAAVWNNVWSDGAGLFTFDNNIWWRVDGGVGFQWGNTAINAWADWQANGFDGNGRNANPALIGRLSGGPSAYFLTRASPAIDIGRTVTDALRG